MKVGGTMTKELQEKSEQSEIWTANKNLEIKCSAWSLIILLSKFINLCKTNPMKRNL